MDHFNYVDGALCAEDVPLERIAEAVGTPFYVYSTATLERHFQVLDEALSSHMPQRRRLIAFAVKACPNIAVIATLARLGAGADVVSEGEMRRALAAGVPGDKIVFSGVGKTDAEIKFALEHNVGQLNVESEPELAAISRVATSMGVAAPIALRVNPDVDARTHAKISTGGAETKFGIPIDRAAALAQEAAAAPGIELVGLATHIGSQLTELEPFAAAFAKLVEAARALSAQGVRLRRLDLGGGLGVPYQRSNTAPPLPFDYGAVVAKALDGFECDVVIEPGRLVAANAGVLVSKIIYVKEGAARSFLVCDAAMNDLARPAIYESWHDIEPVKAPSSSEPVAPIDVVGPICETGDRFAQQRPLPPIAPGELIAFRSAGAYGASMSSEYNSRLLAPEVLVKGDRFEIIRSRPTYAEMLKRDRVPDWLE
ncbi:MAG: diaminopimelate decarboxylase [Neomegalonema sp.]|nr:diaminopimelate decarboxylase [Neomegalonema sp.]